MEEELGALLVMRFRLVLKYKLVEDVGKVVVNPRISITLMRLDSQWALYQRKRWSL